MIAASSAVTLVITQVDKLAMARILSLGQFGTYVIASTLAAAPTSFAFNYTTAIVYPTTAAAWREGRSASHAYYSCWGKFFYMYAFGGGGLIGVADLLIRFLYDPRYEPAAKYLSILAVATAFAMLTRAMQEVMIANGRTRAGLEIQMVRLVWLVAGGLLALARSDAMILVLTIGLIEIPVYCFAAWRMQQMHLIRWRRELTFFLAAGAGLCVGGAMSIAGRIFLPNI
jgi:O-antigen/teichoic acid export membrane protein